MSTDAPRPASELQASDFLGIGVWRFVTPDEMDPSGVDESYVVPEARSPGAGEHGSYLVAARYQLQNGKVLPGFVELGVLDAHFEFTPSTVFAAGRAVDALGVDTSRRLQRLLGTTDVQPLSWRLERPLHGETELRTGSIGKPGLAQALSLLAQSARLKGSRKSS